MKTITNSVERTGIRYGLLTSLALVGYFLLMQAVGLGHIIELRFINFIILCYGIYLGIRSLKNEFPEEDIYFKGLAEGLLITLVAVIPFGMFVGLYLEYVDTNLMNEIRQNAKISGAINGISTFVVINLEGLGSGVLMTYVMMQYFSSKNHKKEISHKKTHEKV